MKNNIPKIIVLKNLSTRVVMVTIFFLTSLTVYCQQADTPGRPSLSQYKRILFLGNSITYEGAYVTNFEAYIKLAYPQSRIEIINMGLPSETVSGLSEPGHAENKFPRPDLHERLERVLSITKPDLVFTCYGINDGIYLPFDEVRFIKYKDGIRWLHEAITTHGAKAVHLTPPFFDENRGKSKGYENVMERYAQWLVSMKDSARWNVMNIYDPMKEYLKGHREVDRKFNLDGFDLASDGIHPNKNAHWLIARTLLLNMGEKRIEKVSSIDAFAGAFPRGQEILALIREKQLMMKDAWLTEAGHKRPEMKKGLPLKEAKERQKLLDSKIAALVADSGRPGEPERMDD